MDGEKCTPFPPLREPPHTFRCHFPLAFPCTKPLTIFSRKADFSDDDRAEGGAFSTGHTTFLKPLHRIPCFNGAHSPMPAPVPHPRNACLKRHIVLFPLPLVRNPPRTDHIRRSFAKIERLYEEFLKPILLVGLFAPPEELSAGVVLGMLYFYVLAHQPDFDVR